MFVSGYISNRFLRFLNNFFIHTPLLIWFRFLTAYWPTSAVWVNYSGVSDSVLDAQWKIAQQGLATAPFPASLGGPNHPADPRALTVQPKHVTVVSVPDVPIADLTKLDAGWALQKDPSGAMVIISSGGVVEYTTCHSFACCWRKPRVYAVASLIPTTLSYEFQNIILSQLGYDVSGR